MIPPSSELLSLMWAHFWQVTVLIAVVGLMTRVGCRRHPHLAHILWMVVFIKCLTPPLWSSPTSVFSWMRLAAAIQPTFSVPETPVREPTHRDQLELANGLELEASGPPRERLETGAPSANLASSHSEASLASVPVSSERPIFNLTVWLVTVWATGALLCGGLAAWRWIHWHQQIQRSLIPTDERAMALMGQLTRCLEIRRRVRLLVTTEGAGPAAYGLLRPVIVLPDLLVRGRSPEAVEPLLAHELVHIRRGDVAFGVLQILAQITWWFHPFVWWANRIASRASEKCCDQEVMAAMGYKPARYARCLLEVLATKNGLRTVFAIPGVQPMQVTKARVEEIMKKTNKFERRTPRWCWLIGLLVGMLILPGREIIIRSGSPAAAQMPPETETLDIGTPTDAREGASFVGDGLTQGARGVSQIILVSGQENVGSGLLSPDETKIAYTDLDASRKYDVIVRELHTGREVGVTQKDYGDPDAYESSEFNANNGGGGCWSPDSQWVAYHWWKNGRTFQLRIARADGSQTRVIKEATKDTDLWVPLSWSPDGKHLVCSIYSDEKNDLDVALVNIETGEETSIGLNHPRFSPDGQWIVGENELGFGIRPNRNIHLINVREPGQVNTLTHEPTNERYPIFSKDGRYVLFDSDRRGMWDLWAVRVVDGARVGDPVLVKWDFGNHPKRLLASGKIAYTSWEENTDIYSVTIGPDANSPISAPRRLSSSHWGKNSGPTWSPDGKQIAYLRGDRLDGQICIQNLDSGKTEIIDTDGFLFHPISWSPNGQHLAFQGGLDPRQILLTSVGDKRTRPLTINNDLFRDPDSAYCQTWSWDGEQIYARVRPGRKHLAIDVETGNTTTITFPGIEDSVDFFHIAPDGNQVLLLVGGSTELVLLNQASGARQTIASHIAGDDGGSFGEPRWSPNGEFFAYFDLVRKALVVVSADTNSKRIVPVTQVRRSAHEQPPAWSPDSRQIAFTIDHERLYEIGVLAFELP